MEKHDLGLFRWFDREKRSVDFESSKWNMCEHAGPVDLKLLWEKETPLHVSCVY